MTASLSAMSVCNFVEKLSGSTVWDKESERINGKIERLRVWSGIFSAKPCYLIESDEMKYFYKLKWITGEIQWLSVSPQRRFYRLEETVRNKSQNQIECRRFTKKATSSAFTLHSNQLSSRHIERLSFNLDEKISPVNFHTCWKLDTFLFRDRG